MTLSLGNMLAQNALFCGLAKLPYFNFLYSNTGWGTVISQRFDVTQTIFVNTFRKLYCCQFFFVWRFVIGLFFARGNVIFVRKSSDSRAGVTKKLYFPGIILLSEKCFGKVLRKFDFPETPVPNQRDASRQIVTRRRNVNRNL